MLQPKPVQPNANEPPRRTHWRTQHSMTGTATALRGLHCSLPQRWHRVATAVETDCRSLALRCVGRLGMTAVPFGFAAVRRQSRLGQSFSRDGPDLRAACGGRAVILDAADACAARRVHGRARRRGAHLRYPKSTATPHSPAPPPPFLPQRLALCPTFTHARTRTHQPLRRRQRECPSNPGKARHGMRRMNRSVWPNEYVSPLRVPARREGGDLRRFV